MEIDRRLKRPGSAYIDALEFSNQRFKTLFKRVKDNIDNTEEVLKIVNDAGINDDFERLQNPDELPRNDSFEHVFLPNDVGTSATVIGPTSVYSDGIIIQQDTKQSEQNTFEIGRGRSLTSEEMAEMLEYRAKYGHHKYNLYYFKETAEYEDPHIRQAISLFFKWLYSTLFLFIHRESFLYFFLSGETNCEYVKMELVYALCALGARVSNDSCLRARSDEFYVKAKALVIGTGDEKHFITELSIIKLQTLLCLALYDLGRGELTSCWLLSGLAFRIGFDVGFERDPKLWNVQNVKPPKTTKGSRSLTGTEREKLYREYPFDIKKLRSRIYWGSYIADRFISLVLGRPVTLTLIDVTVPDTQDIGDLTGIDDFIFFDNDSDRQYAFRGFHCLKAIVELLHISDDVLNKIFGPSISKRGSRLETLADMNSKLFKWKQSLDEELFWNKRILEKTAHNELYMGPRYTYFIILLSINRPFVQMAALGALKSINIGMARIPIQVCDDIIDDLEIVMKALEIQKDKHNVFSPHIFAVYATILAISVLLWRAKIPTGRPFLAFKRQLVLFLNFLECSRDIWPLAAKPAEIYKRKIDELFSFKTSHGNETNIELMQTDMKTATADFGVMDDDNDPATFPLSILGDVNGGDYSNVDDIFQAIFEDPMTQQILTRMNLADTVWDETLDRTLDRDQT